MIKLVIYEKIIVERKNNMKLFKRTLTTAVAVCLALQSAVVCFGAEAEEQIPAGGEEVGLYTSENDEAIQLTEDMYNSWY